MKKKTLNDYLEDVFYYSEMANLSRKKTGLDYIIWIMHQTGKEKHWARIKVKIKGQDVSITISDNPEWLSDTVKINAKEFNRIKKWIIMNKDVLLKYWNGKGEVTIDEIINDLKSI